MTALLLAKILGFLGVILLSIPVIRDGRLFLVFSRLGSTAKSPELVVAIDAIKGQFQDNMINLRRSDLRFIYSGLFVVIVSYVIEIFYIL